MNQRIRVVSCILLLLLILYNSRPVQAEETLMNVRIDAPGTVKDIETGKDIMMIHYELYSLPDTIFVDNFIGNNHERYVFERLAPGTEILVLLKTMEIRKEWYGYKSPEDMAHLEKVLKEQGEYEPIWIGPIVIPDKNNMPEGYVRLELPKANLSRMK